MSVVEICSSMPPDVLEGAFALHALSAHPARHDRWLRDPRLDGQVLVLRHDGHVEGFLPVAQPRIARLGDPKYDPASVARSDDVDARGWLLIGGGSEYLGGVVLAADATEGAASSLFRAAAEVAVDRGLRPIALHVPDDQVELAVEALGDGAERQRTSARASLLGPISSDDEYLASLSRSRRSMVRRDRRDFAARGLTTAVVPFGEEDPCGPEMIASVKRRHGTPDQPALARLRLDAWGATRTGEFIAIEVRDVGGELLAISYACIGSQSLEVLDVGLVSESDARLMAYLEACYYRPIALMIENGCARIDLGTEAVQPKVLRGATTSEMWAVY